MNWDQVENKWEQLIGSAKNNWGRIGDEDFRLISGKREQLVLKIQEAYGITKREAEKQVWDWGKAVENVTKKIA